MRRATLALAATLAAGACAAAAAPAPAPAPAAAADHSHGAEAAADPNVRFMQGMIGHHAQALAMAALVPARSSHEQIHLLAERIAVSQRDEIATMQQWLRERGAEVPSGDPHAHHGDHARMPGMLSEAELAALAAATGTAFDRSFLELMIRHHEGALVMVAELFASLGAAQEPATYALVADVDADQRAEIARMQALLERLR